MGAQVLVNCFTVIRNDGKTLPLKKHFSEKIKEANESLASYLGELENEGIFFLSNTFEMQFKSVTVNVIFNEEDILKQIFTNQEFYKALGLEMCICIDISLVKGRNEAPVDYQSAEYVNGTAEKFFPKEGRARAHQL